MADKRASIVANFLRTKLNVKGTEVPVYRLLDILAMPDGDIAEIIIKFNKIDNKALRKAFHDLAALLRDLEKGSPVTTKLAQKRLSDPVLDKPACDIGTLSKVKVFVDGCSKGNPGPSGAGFVFTDMEDSTVLEGNQYLGEGTNNRAEYQALIFALHKALEHKAKNLLVFCDSQLIVNQINGVYKIKNKDLLNLCKEVQVLRKKFPFVQFHTIERNANKRADKLAEAAVVVQRNKNDKKV